MRTALLEGIYRLVRRRAWLVLLGAALVSLLALFYIRDLPMRSSFLDLLPQGDPLVIIFQERQEIVTKSDALSIRLRLQNPKHSAQDAERLKATAEQLAERLRSNTEIVSVSLTKDIQTRRGDELLSLRDQFYLKFREYQERLRQILPAPSEPAAPQAGVAELVQHYARINTELRPILGFDPVELVQSLEEFKALNESVKAEFERAPARLQATDKLLSDLLVTADEIQQTLDEVLSWPAELNLSKDGTKLLVNVRPKQSSQYSLDYNRALTRFVRETLQNARLEEQEIDWGITGPYAISAETNLQLSVDMRNTTILSAFGVLIVIILTLRRFFYSLLALIVLFLALIVTLAWAKFAADGLNLVTSFLPALILGLGIDYGINFIAHVLDERRAGARFEAALKSALLHKGSALMTASLATACVLFGLMVAGSPGLYEMGIIAGIGVLLALGATLLVLPSLMIVTHIMKHRRSRGRPVSAPTTETKISERTDKFWQWARVPIVALIAVGSTLMLQEAVHVGFRFADEDLAPQALPARAVQREVRSDFDTGSSGLGEYFFFFTANIAELRRVTAGLEEIKKRDFIDAIYSIATFLPPEEGESQRFLESLQLNLARDLQRAGAELDRQSAELKLLQNLAEQITQIKASITEISGRIGIFGGAEQLLRVQEEFQKITLQLESLEASISRLETQQGSLQGLQARLEQLDQKLQDLLEVTINLQQVGGLLSVLPKELQERFVTEEREFVAYAHLKRETINEPARYRAFIQAARELNTDYLGYPMIQESLERKMQRDFQISTLLAAAIILVILGVGLGWGWALLGVVPVGLGFLWMLGMMRLSGLNFNFANIIISSLLIGNGVDYAVYLLHSFQEQRSVGRAWRLTALPILGSALTTMVSFGSLLFAATPGLRVFGLSALYGIGFTALFTLVFLPAVLACLPARRDPLPKKYSKC